MLHVVNDSPIFLLLYAHFLIKINSFQTYTVCAQLLEWLQCIAPPGPNNKIARRTRRCQTRNNAQGARTELSRPTAGARNCLLSTPKWRKKSEWRCVCVWLFFPYVARASLIPPCSRGVFLLRRKAYACKPSAHRYQEVCEEKVCVRAW